MCFLFIISIWTTESNAISEIKNPNVKKYLQELNNDINSPDENLTNLKL